MIIKENKPEKKPSATPIKDIKPGRIVVYRDDPNGELKLGFTNYNGTAMCFVDYNMLSDPKKRINGWTVRGDDGLVFYDVRYVDKIDEIVVTYMDDGDE